MSAASFEASFGDYFAISQLLSRTVNLLDASRLEEWVDCFADDGRYYVLSRENYERKLPLKLFQCDNKNMMHDRVLSLRQANVVNIHRDQHVTGLPQLAKNADGTFRADSGYALYTTDQGGISQLFGVGAYMDTIRIESGQALFVERNVIVDTFSIPNMLSTPI
ncbi:MAG: anthranilate 1,2-dioxygenase [Betaproteobacteria bacterium]|nr:anthranilate 1,2-dioxygenase [Betaproteobacteria bacterium]